MPLYYVTGISGAGKSTVFAELKKRGYHAHGVDEEGYGEWLNKTTGEVDSFPEDDSSLDLHDWFATHTWVINEEKVRRLAAHARENPEAVFLCGNANGDERVWNEFEKVFVLKVDDETVKSRVATRTNNHFGKHPRELKAIMEWHETMYDIYEGYGSVTIDATRSIEAVTQDILEQTK